MTHVWASTVPVAWTCPGQAQMKSGPGKPFWQSESVEQAMRPWTVP
jgi:hypothetical protein